MEDLLNWLQQIYKNDFCNDSWEHVHGVSIDTLDPGWDFKFDLRDTYLENSIFEDIFVKIDNQNWYQCWLKEGIFHGWGGPTNITDILKVFHDWYVNAVRNLDEKKSQ